MGSKKLQLLGYKGEKPIMSVDQTKANDLPIFDIYVLSDGGTPIFAGCSSSDYCASHEGQHPLHTGFIHALQNFSNEVFSSKIQTLELNNVKLKFKNIDPYTIVFVNPDGVSDEFIQRKLTEVGKLFKEKYADKVNYYTLSEELYNEFMDDIVELGLIAKNRIKSTRSIFVTETETMDHSDNRSIFSRFKQKFENLIKR